MITMLTNPSGQLFIISIMSVIDGNKSKKLPKGLIDPPNLRRLVDHTRKNREDPKFRGNTFGELRLHD